MRPTKINSALVEATRRRYIYLARRSPASLRTAFQFRRGPRIFLSQPGVMKLSNAIILSGEWFVISDERIFCDAFVQTPYPPLSAYSVQRRREYVELLYETPEPLAVSEAFLLGGCRNYAHWLIDFLPRFQLCRDPGIPLLVHDTMTVTQSETLALLNIDADRLIRLGYPKAYFIQTLRYPSTRSSIMAPFAVRPEIVDWLRETFAPLLTSERPRRRIFISRATGPGQYRRRLLNHEEIVRIAADHDFEVISSENLSFLEQVKIFSEATVITGPRGAGFANIVFAPKGARIIELIGPRYSEQRSGWAMISSILEQKFSRIVGRSDPRTPIALNHIPYETYTIDPEEFSRAVRDS